MDNSLITIIVPVYNASEYLSKCLNTIINQTYRNIEIICINDGSVDNSLEILKEFHSYDKRIKIIDKKNEGVSIARNEGLSVAKGDYLIFVDSDDWIDLQMCEVALKAILEENADVVMWSYIREYPNKSLPKEIYRVDTKLLFNYKEVRGKLHRRFIGLIGEELSEPENADALCTIWGKIYKMDIIRENSLKFYDITSIGSYEDGLFNLYYFEHVKKAVYLPKYMYHYKKNNNESVTTQYNKKLYEQWDNLFNIMDQYIINKKYGKEYNQALDNRISLSILKLGLNVASSNKKSIEKIREIRKIITSERYMNSVKTLNLKYFAIPWKLYYGCAKRGNALGVYFLVLCMNKVIESR
ncbi:glycosyltransferase family 2 protein [Clostridium estertheticum]|uniref:Glycosyltransferase 2-like domain-containing protein n=1 Tax=Clostridium estertheticum subsp. estertheticum TaxID=1552 RepID=A0A1J0GKV4_9CLOT|nr:glycosyltransferase family 2 protein [Clostridium estertheticum]APC41947.1 hypothetical protein A7L45_18700 [Clostridium estertheticum subsp. estertheticum]